MMFPHLVLGNYRYLDVFGKVHEATPYTDDEIELNKRIAPSFDAQEEAAPNSPTRLTEDNRAYWEANAARGGHTLSELLTDAI